jgi:hypothetical protein
MMAISTPTPYVTSFLGYTVPDNLQPSTKTTIEKRLAQPAEKKLPNPQSNQAAEPVALVQTLGRQPVSFKAMVGAALAASVFAASWGVASKNKLQFFTASPENHPTADMKMTSMVRLDQQDELGLKPPIFYYTTTEESTAGKTMQHRHWKQWEEPHSEESLYTRYCRTEQKQPFNPNELGLATTENTLPVGGLSQTYSGQGMCSRWQDDCGVAWEVHHTEDTMTAERSKQYRNRDTSIAATEAVQEIETEKTILVPQIVHLTWQDSGNVALEHSLRINRAEGITYQHSLNGVEQVQALTIAEIAEGKFQSLLKDINNLPASLQEAHRFVEVIESPFFPKSSDKPLTEKNVTQYCNIIGPEPVNALTDTWRWLHEKNQPMRLNEWKTLSHKAKPFLLPSLIGAVGAGLGLLGLHWWQEKQHNQTILDALGRATNPETITYTQAKKYHLLG